MNAELTNKLIHRFKFYRPEIPITQSLMCFGFEHGDGWFDIIWELSEGIEKELQKIEKKKTTKEKTKEALVSPEYDFNVMQVKEKFGTLRFYCSWETDEIETLIRKAEAKSSKTCEHCGKSGKLITDDGWYYTACKKCRAKGADIEVTSST